MQSELNPHSDAVLIAFPTVDNGTEWMWGQRVSDGYEVLNVPVFCYDISRGSIVQLSPRESGQVEYHRTLRASPGGTIRCYVEARIVASDAYLAHIVPQASTQGLEIGPATFFDPDVVAIHVKDRRELTRVGAMLDGLHARGIVRFWEIGDPTDGAADEEEGSGEPWKLEHPFPDEGCNLSVKTG